MAVEFDVPITGARRRRAKAKNAEAKPAAEAPVQTPPAAVSHETSPQPLSGVGDAAELARQRELEAELARRRATQSVKPLAQMTEAELEAELARRRGLPPPERPAVAADPALSGTARLNGSAEEPPPGVVNSPLGDLAQRLSQFAANPAAEMHRLLTMGADEAKAIARPPSAVAQPALQAVSTPPLPMPQTDEKGDLVRRDMADTPFRPLRPADIQQPDQETWYEMDLPGGGRVRVRASDMVPMASSQPAAEGTPNFRCMIEGTNIARGCPDFFLDRAAIPAGTYPRCPKCGGRALLPLE